MTIFIYHGNPTTVPLMKGKLLILEPAIHLIIHTFSLSLSFPVTKYTTRAPTSTTKKMTACEQLRSSTKDFTSTGRYYIPLCTITGEYEKRQCEGKPGSKKCWCVNPKGVEIPGTQMMEPDMPDCHKGTVKPTLNGTSIYITNHCL